MTQQLDLDFLKSLNVRDLKQCQTAEEALQCLQEVYFQSIKSIQKTFSQLMQQAGDISPVSFPQDATYPCLVMHIPNHPVHLPDHSMSYGVAPDRGIYMATITRPDLLSEYYLEQISLLIEHHKVPVYVGASGSPIPLPFAMQPEILVPSSFDQLEQVQRGFALPDLSTVDDSIANGDLGTGEFGADALVRPLALFSGQRVDLSLHRLHYYTGTSMEHFQRFILLTNYQRYVDAFLNYGKKMLEEEDGFETLVEPGDRVTHLDEKKQLQTNGELMKDLPQMPAYHLTRPDRNGITFINIGVGPSNAKTITDHLAVLRPHCWLMLGHCAGLRRNQLLGDYVLAHAYVRADHVMDDDVPSWIPIPPIAEIQVALQQAVAKVTGQEGQELKSRMRTGTVFTTDNRNWEFRSGDLCKQFQQSRAMAVDMESATVAANGFRFRVPYGTLLCISDKPIHGEIKLRGMANLFYRKRVDQHLQIGLEAINILRTEGPGVLHSRKLRGFSDPPFR